MRTAITAVAVTLVATFGAFCVGCDGELGGGAPGHPSDPSDDTVSGPVVDTEPLDAGKTPAPPGTWDAGGGPSGQLAADYGVCSNDNVCWELPAPQGHTLHAVFALSGDDVWAVGERGTVVHFDGRGFRRHVVDTQADLRAVHASAPDNVWVVGDQGVVMQFDGERWAKHELDAIVDASKGSHTGNLNGVLALGQDMVWVVGHSGVAGVVGRYDGERWVDESLAVDTDHELRAVWGLSNEDIWVVGDQGTIRRYDGIGFRRATSPTGENLYAVHGAAEDEVWLVGKNATAARWDGQDLRLIDDGIASQLQAVVVGAPPPQVLPIAGPSEAAVVPDARVWAFGSDGRIYRYNDLAWTEFASGAQTALHGATSLGAGELIAVGQDGFMQHYRGDQRATLSYGSGRSHMALFGMPNGDLWSVGDEVIRADQGGWGAITSDSTRSLFDAWGDADGVWAVGTAGTVLHFTDAGVDEVSPRELAGTWLRAIWGTSDSLWLVGHDGAAVRHRDATWMTMNVAGGVNLIDVWGLAEDDVWIVGDEATTLHWNGATWLSLPASDVIDGDVSLRSIWGSRQDDVWAVGSLGAMIHWTGAVWENSKPLGTFTLNAVWGRSSDDVYAAGTGGTLLHFDGDAWDRLDSGTSRSLEAIGQGPDGRIRIAGLDGTMLVIK